MGAETLKWLWSTAIELLWDRSANFAVTSAILAVPVIASTGFAIDFALALDQKIKLQAMADSAVLAVAASAETNHSKIKAEASELFLASAIKSGAQGIQVRDVEYNQDRQITMTVDAKVPLTLGQILFSEGIGISITASAQQGMSTPIEVALVLDNTASMSGEKIEDLRDASLALIATLEKSNPELLHVALVPFSNYVNVGLENRSARWMDVPANYTQTKNVCTTTRPVVSKSGCRNETVVSYNDGVPVYSTKETCTSYTYGPETTTCTDQKQSFTWRGCVGSRTAPLDAADAFSGTRWPGLLNVNCSAALTPLTSNMKTVRTAIAAMKPQYNTYIPAGLVWGWATLSDEEPFEEAASREGSDKYIVLMTDGENTLRASGATHVTDSTGRTASTLTSQLCKNIKESGIKVFTVGVGDLNKNTQDMLAGCASFPDYATFASDTSTLSSIFESFAVKMMTPRLLK